MTRVLRTLGITAIIAFAAMSSGSAQQRARGFDGYFADKTMRVDYFHSGGVGQEIVALERIVSDGPWPGSRTRLVDDTNLGKYLFEVIDRGTNTVIYSRGFAIDLRRVGNNRRSPERCIARSRSRCVSPGRRRRAGRAEEARRGEQLPRDLVNRHRS